VKFQKYEVVPLRDLASPVQCEERNAQFWGLYGINKDDDAFAIGDFDSKADAEFIKDALIASA